MQSLPTNVLYDIYCPKSDRWFRQEGALRKGGVKIHPFHLPWIRACARFHCFGSFLLIWYPSFQIMPQQEQSGVPKAKATRKAPLSVAATSEVTFTNLKRLGYAVLGNFILFYFVSSLLSFPKSQPHNN